MRNRFELSAEVAVKVTEVGEMKILYLTPLPPWPPTRGGNQRSNILYQALSQLGEVHTFLPSNAALTKQQAEVLRSSFGFLGQKPPKPRGAHGFWRHVHRLAPRITDRIAHNLGSHSVRYLPDVDLKRAIEALDNVHAYDLIIGRYLQPTAAAGGLGLRVPTIVDIDDLEVQKYESRLAKPGASHFEQQMSRLHIRRYKSAIGPTVSRASHIWVTAEEDLGVLEHPSQSVLPNIPYPGISTSAHPLDENIASKTILAVASMKFAVNERAIDRFVSSIWPGILSRDPSARLVIAGSNMSEAQRAEWSSSAGVTALGFVENLDDLYRNAAFTVVPIFEGGGTKIKVLESLLYNRTAVVASHSMRGYRKVLHHPESVLVADTEEAIIENCLILLRSPDLRARMAAAGRDVVMQEFSMKRFCAQVAADVSEVLDRANGFRRQANPVPSHASNHFHAT